MACASLLGDSIAEFHGLDGRLERAVTRAGREIPAQLAIVGVGVRPSTAYLEGSGVAMEKGAVLVNERFETNVSGVYAAGDVASFHDPVFGHRRLIQHWTNANHHGERLGRLLAGENAPYDLVAYFFSEVFGTKLGLLGDLEAGHDDLVVRGSLEEGDLTVFYLRESRLVAALVSGSAMATQDELSGLLREAPSCTTAQRSRMRTARQAPPSTPRRARRPSGRPQVRETSHLYRRDMSSHGQGHHHHRGADFDWEAMAEKLEVDGAFVLPLVDAVVDELAAAGIGRGRRHPRHRRSGAGRGWSPAALARHFPSAQVTGLDSCSASSSRRARARTPGAFRSRPRAAASAARGAPAPGHRSSRARSSTRTIVMGRPPSDSSGSLHSEISLGTSCRYRSNRTET